MAENDHLPLTWHIALTTVYALTCYTVMDGWYVQVKGYEGDGGRSILLCGKGYRQHPQLGEQMSAGRHGKTQSA